jgi:hypothetical protein
LKILESIEFFPTTFERRETAGKEMGGPLDIANRISISAKDVENEET